MRLAPDLALVQTVDFFPPVHDDPVTWGEIGAANAMNDVFAMGGEVLVALNVGAFPDDLDPEIIADVFRGGIIKVHEAGGAIVGGHTMTDREPKYGLAVTGLVHPDRVVRKRGAQPGDVVFLSKPLGTGVVVSSVRSDVVSAETYAGATASMRRLGRHAMHLALAHDVHAMTDITGFGLVGHAAEMAQAGGVRLVIGAGRVPQLPGVLDLYRRGYGTAGTTRNEEYYRRWLDLRGDVEPSLLRLLHDPQTSGGLLMAVPAERAEALDHAATAEHGPLWRIGVVEAGEPAVEVRP